MRVKYRKRDFVKVSAKKLKQERPLLHKLYLDVAKHWRFIAKLRG